MQNYKTTNNQLHVLDSAEFAHLLPAGCIPITEVEAEAIRIANIPAPTRAQLIAEIDAQRDTAINAGFTHSGHLYHCDPTFQSQVQAFLLAWTVGMLPPAATVQIRRYDNTTATMTQAEVVALAGALMAYVQGIYSASWAAKDVL